ncbi:MAG TPA: alkaline phosphatase family protein [Candidatus Angelobacter sp.]|nr:alkaline phosphatase family protein [Candidatus Angelobacter sp.]
MKALKTWEGNFLQTTRAMVALVALMLNFFSPLVQSAQAQANPAKTPTKDAAASLPTASPIKHVIVVVGENRSFDHIFATYQPKAGNTVNNLLSEGIVNIDGTPGTNYSKALQYSADVSGSTTFQLSPTSGKTPYSVLPPPLNGGPTDVCADNKICSLGEAYNSEKGLSRWPLNYYQYMLTGGTGLTGHVPDSRVTSVSASSPYSTLPGGPFQYTNSTTFPYDSYAASPVHRFFQMWQQLDCNASTATSTNPSGCLADYFTWTEVTVGSNNNGLAQPSPFCTFYAPGCAGTNEGATSMGFYNIAQGDEPYTKFLADHYAMSDNYHQPAKGGTGLDSIMLFFGDAIYFSDSNGNPQPPPHNQMTWAGGPVDEVENPDSQTGTNNFWIQDGYGGFGNNPPSTGVYGGGSYVNCSDSTQPGVSQVLNYLSSLTPPIAPNCAPNAYYLVNNYNPGYFGDGSNAYTDSNPSNTPFTIPGTTQASIGDVLLASGVSWKGYNDQWGAYLGDKYQLHYGTPGARSDQYCNICNGFNYQKQIMTNASVRTSHLTDITNLYSDIFSNNLPAVSFVKPSGWADGHPASSKWDLYEGFVKNIVQVLQTNPALYQDTVIFVTTDEGGGYYDSGYVQTLDFFGDGTRIPLIAISRYTIPGYISHTYTDHVSVLKFIERNWGLPTISSRSRDNMPNPISSPSNPYVPTNSPAIGDLFDLFDFSHPQP